jgi:hypothetical protein
MKFFSVYISYLEHSEICVGIFNILTVNSHVTTLVNTYHSNVYLHMELQHKT